MKIDYDDVKATLLNATSVMNAKSEFLQQVVSDGGQFFFGVISPSGVRMQIGVNNKAYDQMLEEDEAEQSQYDNDRAARKSWDGSLQNLAPKDDSSMGAAYREQRGGEDK